jgi:hypothetical protein
MFKLWNGKAKKYLLQEEWIPENVGQYRLQSHNIGSWST